MKKGNRVLAMFLAVAMIFTSISWDFGDVKAETSGETTSAITTTDDGVSIDFDNIDVAELDANGYTSTRFKSGEAVSGEVNRPVSEHWFSGEGDDTPYGSVDANTIKTKNIGLKSNDSDSDNTRTFMYTPYSYEDFQVSAEIYYGAWSGIVFGEKNVYPKDEQTATSVAVFFNGGILNIVGSVDISTTKILRGSAANIDKGSAKNGRFLGFNNGSKTDILGHVGDVYTVNVRKTGDYLFVWISGGAGLIRIKLAETYKTGSIGIQSEYYDLDGGGFNSLKVDKINVDETHILKTQTMEQLDDLGYFASVGSTSLPASQKSTSLFDSVGRAFYVGTQGKDYTNTSTTLTSGNDGVKTRASGTSIGSLNIPYIYTNFRLKVTMYHGQVIGAALGPDSSTPVTSGTPSGISVYFNSGVVETFGKIDNSKATGGSKSGTYMYKLTPKDADGNAFTPIRDETTCTMVIEVKNGILKTWLEGYSGYASMPITDGFSIEKISLIARNKIASPADKGGFISYTITNLDAGDKADFDNAHLNNLDAAGYTAAKSSEASNTGTVSTHWFSGYSDKYSYTSETTYANEGLKSVNNDAGKNGEIRILNTPHAYKNFRLKANVYPGQVLGVQIGLKGKGVQVGSGNPTSGSVSIYINEASIGVFGAIDYASRQLNGANKSKDEAGSLQYIPVGNTEQWGNVRTLIIEVQNGILSVAYADLEHVFRVKLNDSYEPENIAFFARCYCVASSNAGGGLKGYEIEKLPDTYNIGTTVDLGMHTDFANVNIAKLEEKGFTSTRFDFSDYSVSGDVDQAVSNHWFAGKLDMASTGVVAASTNQGLKPNAPVGSSFTVLNTPYTAEAGYENYHVSTEVYGGTSAGIVLGEKNTCPSSTSNTVRIYFNTNNTTNQIQIYGGGIDPDSAVVSGGATWSAVFAPTYIFKPASDFVINEGEIYKLNVEVQNGTLTIWVDGYNGVLSLNTKKTFVNDGIALGAEYYVSSGLKSLTVKKLSEDIVLPYTADEFATYRSADGHTAPTYKHYLFAGWYTDAACNDYTKAVPYNALTTDAETVYAKFVPRYVMTVKAQISAELLDDNLKNDTTGQIRFATTVDSENYSLAGFKVSYDKDGDGTPTDVYSTSKTVWTELTAIGNMTYEPNDFCQISKYFKTCVVKPFEDTYFGMEFEVTPCWRTLDGTYVYGDTVVKTVDQGINTKVLNGKRALLLGDSIQAGNNTPGEGHLLWGWYQRLEQYYGMDADGVGQKGWTLTNKETSGRLQIITQFDLAEQGKEYDFVILEGGVNDVLIDQDNANITIDWGTINEDAAATFTDDNIAGAMQELIVTAKEKYPNAKIVYIINHYFEATEENMERYVAMVKAACRVHDISYVDLSDVEAYPSLAPLAEENPDYSHDGGLHPNAAGYELSTPVIANHLRKLVTGEFTKTVYVASTGTDAKGYGTEAEPYQSLNYAMSKVADDGTVYVEDTLTCVNEGSTTAFSMGGYGVETGKNIESKTNIIDKVNHKQVTIAGVSDTAKLEFPVATSGPTYLYLNASIILKDIRVQWPSRIFAEGNTFVVEKSVTQEGDKEPMLMGGSNHHDLDSTDLRIYAGTYQKIIGGALGKTIGETNVIVGGNVNSGIDTSSHKHDYVLLGGSYSEGNNCVISGDTNVIVEQGAKFNYVFGAGAVIGDDKYKTTSSVLGDTHVTFAGEAMSVNGGACARLVDGTAHKTVPCNNTNVTIVEGAKVQQVFGGSEFASINGNANVNLLGGTVSRRVYGGCYNEEDGTTTYYANGTVTVTVNPAAQLTLSEDTDNSFAAISRHATASANEKGIFIFNDYTNNQTNIGKVGIDWLAELAGLGSKTHDHLVKVGANGTVKVVNGKLVVTPNSEEYTATVTGADINEDGTYTMTAKDIVVTFN